MLILNKVQFDLDIQKKIDMFVFQFEVILEFDKVIVVIELLNGGLLFLMELDKIGVEFICWVVGINEYM